MFLSLSLLHGNFSWNFYGGWTYINNILKYLPVSYLVSPSLQAPVHLPQTCFADFQNLLNLMVFKEQYKAIKPQHMKLESSGNRFMLRLDLATQRD